MRHTVVVILAAVCMGTNTLALAQDAGAKPPKKNPVKATPESVKAGQQAFAVMCRACHGPIGRGDGTMATKNPPPADLTDAKWDYGSSDGEIFAVILNGVPKEKTVMKGLKGKLADTDIWNIVNYLRSLEARRASK